MDGGSGSDTLDLSGSTLLLSIGANQDGSLAVGYSGLSGTLIQSISNVERLILSNGDTAVSLGSTSQSLTIIASGVLNGLGSAITAGTGNDTIIGGDGTDSVRYTGGNDRVTGNASADQLSLDSVLPNIAAHIDYSGGAGRDDLIVTSAALAGHGASIDMAAGTATVGQVSISFDGVEQIFIGGTGTSEQSTVLGSSGNDTLQFIALGGLGGSVELRGRGGNDYLLGGVSGDKLYGDDGNDQLYGEGSNDQLVGGNGDDTIGGGAGNNFIDGGEGNDVLFGGASTAEQGGAGADTITGGGGADHIYGNALSGGPGSFGDNGNSLDQGDYIDAGSGSDYVNGNGGADTILGGEGGDRIQGGSGSDSIDGGVGTDQINGNLGNDTISGGEGNDILRGGKDDDVLAGGGGNDILSGDLGNDTLRAGPGHDNLLGGDGIDLFDFSENGSASINPDGDGFNSVVLDFVDGTDHLELAFTVTAGNVLYQDGNFSSVSQAQAAAQSLLSSHAGMGDVAAVQVGQDTYIFYNAAGTGDTINSVIGFIGVSATKIDAADFVV